MALPKKNFFQSWKGLMIVTFLFVTFASFLFWLDFFRGYQTQMSVLVIGRGMTDGSVVAKNLSGITQTLSFYERVLAGNENIDDRFAEESSSERLSHWQGVNQVSRGGDTDILNVVTRGDSPEESRELALATTKSLFEVAAFYYTIRTDVDLRVIDGPLTAGFINNPLLYGAISLASGLLVTILFFALLWFVPRVFSFAFASRLHKKKEAEEIVLAHLGESVPLIDPTKFVPEKLRNLSFEGEKPLVKENAHRPLFPQSLSKSEAPANLPFAENNFPKFGEEMISEKYPKFENLEEKEFSLSQFSEAGPIQPKTEEPTAEEYKRRLNVLLAGK